MRIFTEKYFDVVAGVSDTVLQGSQVTESVSLKRHASPKQSVVLPVHLAKGKRPSMMFVDFHIYVKAPHEPRLLLQKAHNVALVSFERVLGTL